MLLPKQIRMLKLLDEQVNSCKLCKLKSNGTSIPYWTKDAKYVIINESPNYADIRRQKPFSGQAGDLITKIFGEVGFKSQDFLIINTVQCRCDYDRRRASSKPTEDQLFACENYLRKYIKVLNPEKILCLGNYSKYIFTREFTGIMRQRGIFKEYSLEGSDKKYNVLFTVQPSYCMFAGEESVDMLKEDIQLFKDAKFQIESDWVFSEDEFLI